MVGSEHIFVSVCCYILFDIIMVDILHIHFVEFLVLGWSPNFNFESLFLFIFIIVEIPLSIRVTAVSIFLFASVLEVFKSTEIVVSV
jgi:hypothetical protein